jgi:hypothetical protein
MIIAPRRSHFDRGRLSDPGGVDGGGEAVPLASLERASLEAF